MRTARDEGSQLSGRMQHHRREAEEARAVCDAFEARRLAQPGGAGLELEARGLDEATPFGAYRDRGVRIVLRRFDRGDREARAALEADELFFDAPLVVARAAVAEVDEDAALIREVGFVCSVRDRRTDDAVSQRPVAHACVAVGAARAQGLEARLGDPLRDELGVRGKRWQHEDDPQHDGAHTVLRPPEARSGMLYRVPFSRRADSGASRT